MFILHRIMMKIRKYAILFYYKLIYGKKFQYGSNFNMRSNFRLFIESSGSIVFGENCFVNNYFSATAIDRIKIGNDCIFGEGVKIYDHNHKFREKNVPIYKQGFSEKEVVIGNNCWIASNVVILAGVHIGDNCVIGANCLIYKDILDNSIVKHEERTIVGGVYES